MEKVETGPWRETQRQGSVEGWEEGEGSMFIRMTRDASLRPCHLTNTCLFPLGASPCLLSAHILCPTTLDPYSSPDPQDL